MKNLNELTIANNYYDLEEGFFFIEFENGKSLQCLLSLKQDNCDSDPYHVAAIEIGNNGYNDCMLGDCNAWAVVDGEWSHIEDFLIEQARNVGLQIIG